jgi:hypothetical protein
MQRGDGQETRSRRALRALAKAIAADLWEQSERSPDTSNGADDAGSREARSNGVPDSNRPTREGVDDGE